MKYLISLFVLSLILAACGGMQGGHDDYPQDLEGKKRLLKEKRAEFMEISQLITRLEGEIETLDPNQKEKIRRTVTTINIGRTDFKHFVEIQGRVEADDLVDVTSEVPGRILSLTVKEGQFVRKDQLIAKLDLEQINKQIAELEKSLELANTVFERRSRLWAQNIGSEIQYLEAKNSKERLEKSLETIKFQLSKEEVYAPISGLVEKVVLQSGELASVGMPIVQILNTNELKVVADVPETYLRAISKGDLVTIRFPVLDSEQKVRVSLLAPTIDPANRTFEVEVNISNSGGVLKPNLLAVMLINDYQEKDVISIPLELVQQEVSGKDYVLVRGSNSNGDFAKKVYVKTGKSYQGEIIISQGLEGDEELILEGARGLAENELIEVKNSKREADNG